MFKIALVQNISEMRNYSYADLRQNLRDLHFEVSAYTQENIQDFLPLLQNGDIDCVLFASNSLNDKKIYEYVKSPHFCERFSDYLAKDGACLVLHQNALKNVETPFPFLGEVGLLTGSYADDSIGFAPPKEAVMEYFSFPNRVTVDDVCNTCKNSAMPGKYWQLLTYPDNVWSPIFCDSKKNGLILRHNEKKVVYSSLILDYQKHLPLLQNLLVNLLAENRALAILEDETTETLGFNYFLNSLENKKLYYKKYPNTENGRKELIENTRMGIHSTILVKKGALNTLPTEITETIEKYGIKLIEITDRQQDRADTFVVHSVDKNLSLHFAHLELAVQEELTQGFISGSFMKTIDVLSLMKEFEGNGLTKGHYDATSIAAVLRRIEPHIQAADGSYDETFGATCKALWLFLNFLGKNNSLTKNAYSYVKNHSSVDTIREFLEQQHVLAQFEKQSKAYLTAHCADTVNGIIAKRFSCISEYDFLTVFKVAKEIGDENQLMALFSYIQENTDEDGKFFSSYVTSVITSYLIDIYDVIKEEENRERLRRLLFDLVLYIRKTNTAHLPLEEALHVVCTLYKFETVVSFPIGDLTEIIFKTGNFPHEYKNVERNISRFQDARLEMDTTKEENDKLSKENKKLKKQNKLLPLCKVLTFTFLTLFAVALYTSVYLVIMLVNSGVPVISTLFDKIVESWPSLFSLLIIPLVSILLKKYFSKKEKDD